MYIEFKLPAGAGGQAAAYTNYLLDLELRNWARKYNILYNSKIFKYTKRVTFNDDATYSFFTMTWNPINHDEQTCLLDYRLVEPMNTRDK